VVDLAPGPQVRALFVFGKGKGVRPVCDPIGVAKKGTPMTTLKYLTADKLEIHSKNVRARVGYSDESIARLAV